MGQPSFASKCQILGDYWSQYRKVLATNDLWSGFISENQRGFLLSYALWRELVDSPSQLGIDLIDETYVKFCDLLWIDSAHSFDSLEDALSYSLDPPVSVARSKRDLPSPKKARASRRVTTATSRQFTSKFGERSKARGVNFIASPAWPRVVGLAIAAGFAVIFAAILISHLGGSPGDGEIGVEPRNIVEPTLDVDDERSAKVESGSVTTYTQSTGRGRESSQPTPKETQKRINFDFSQGATSNTQDGRPTSGPGSGCKVGVADGDRCVGVRPIPGPRGPIPQPFSIPREPPPPPPPNQPKIDEEAPGSLDDLYLELEDFSE